MLRFSASDVKTLPEQRQEEVTRAFLSRSEDARSWSRDISGLIEGWCGEMVEGGNVATRLRSHLGAEGCGFLMVISSIRAS